MRPISTNDVRNLQLLLIKRMDTFSGTKLCKTLDFFSRLKIFDSKMKRASEARTEQSSALLSLTWNDKEKFCHFERQKDSF